MIKQTIIVNADDFGSSIEANEGIAVSFQQQLIDRTTLMVNMPSASEAVKLASELGFTDRIGLHLNLTEGVPLTESIKDTILTDNSGNLTKNFIAVLRHGHKLNMAEKEAVMSEIKAQMDLFRNYGLTNSHLDSHHHVHNEIQLLGMIMREAADYGFRSMRILRNLMPYSTPRDVVKWFYKYIQNKRIAKEFTHTDYFGSVADYERYGVNKRGSIELMVHPIMKDGVLSDSVECDSIKILKKNRT